MMQVNSIGLQGKDNRQVGLRRVPEGVQVIIPVANLHAFTIKPTHLQGDVLNWVLPLLYGDPDQSGKFDCTDQEMRQVIRHIERLF